MKRRTLLIVVAGLLSAVAVNTAAFGPTKQEIKPIFVTEIPAGYRDWK